MFNSVENIKNILIKNEFLELKETESFSKNIKKLGKYFVIKNNSAIIAFSIGENPISEVGFKIISAHTDSPGIKIKTNPIISTENYNKLNVEVYGSPILSTWFDRPLSIAGKIVDNDLKSYIINIEEPLFIIPNLCIHFNKDINNGHKIEKQKELLPIYSTYSNKLNIFERIIKSLKIENILEHDLFLYENSKANIIGEDFISSSRLDNLQMCFSGLEALISSKDNKNTKVLALFDNEEVGSLTDAGANSLFLNNILKRIMLNNYSNDDFYRALANSFNISADQAHAVHPNYKEKHDPTNRPILGKGPVIKYSSNKKYSTTSETASYFKNLCKETNSPYQMFVNHSDIIGGATIGPIISSSLSIPTVDVGNGILAMHSIRELGSITDYKYITKVFEHFFNKN